MLELLQIVLRGVDDAALFQASYAGGRAAVAAARAQAHFHKNQGAIGCAHNGINFSAAAPGCLVVALQQGQALLLQPGNGSGLGRIARLFAAGRLAGKRILWRRRCLLRVGAAFGGKELIDTSKETQW